MCKTVIWRYNPNFVYLLFSIWKTFTKKCSQLDEHQKCLPKGRCRHFDETYWLADGIFMKMTFQCFKETTLDKTSKLLCWWYKTMSARYRSSCWRSLFSGDIGGCQATLATDFALQWRHNEFPNEAQITSISIVHWMETFTASLALCEGNPPVTDGFPSTKFSDAELSCFLLSASEQMLQLTIEMPVILNAIALAIKAL